MTETLVQSIIDALGGSVGKEAIVFIISMIPILELRGALLVAGPLLGRAGGEGDTAVYHREYYSGALYPASDHANIQLDEGDEAVQAYGG